MKSKYLSILLLSWTLTANCIPAFIPHNRVVPTEEQVAGYQEKLRESPDEYEFNPMHIGDRWWYLVEDGWGPPQVLLFREVYADTLINEQVCYKVSGISGSQSTYWIYNDGDIVYAYDHADADDNPDTDFLYNENFGLNSPADSCFTYRTLGYQGPLIPTWIRLFEQGYANIFGEVLLNKTIVYEPETIPMIQYIQWSPKFGPVYMISEHLWFSLVGCRINGVDYGDIDVANEDECLDTSMRFETNIYPNPFKDYVNIQVKGEQRDGNNTISFYNVKGQHLKTMKTRDNNMKINTIDFLSPMCSSGIYFCKITSDSGSFKTTKLLYVQ